MNADNIYLRYFTNESGEETNEQFISISELNLSGVPIDEDGGEYDTDGFIYTYLGGGNNFVKITGVSTDN
jgi:hypothetical protein